jgi:hypothetical protein
MATSRAKWEELTVADDDRTLTGRLIQAGSEIAGTMSGVAFGSLIAGSPGVFAAAGLAPVVATVVSMGAEFAQRRLSPREWIRVGALIKFASERVQDNLDAGQTVRDDGFLADPPRHGRRASDEIAEEIAQVVQRQAQERKIRYLGNLLGNLVFDPDVDLTTAHRVLSTAEELSYTQFQLLGLYLRNDIPLPDRRAPEIECSWRAATAGYELADLGFGARELILPNVGETGILPRGVPSKQHLSSRGRLLAMLLGLDALPADEARDVAEALWERDGSAPPWPGEGAAQRRS